VISQCEQLVGSRRARQPRTNTPIKPGLLLIGVVPRHERPEAVRTDVARHDQEIALRDVWQEPVLIAKRNDAHMVNSPNNSLIVASKVKVEGADGFVQNFAVFINNEHAGSIERLPNPPQFRKADLTTEFAKAYHRE
jgi:hypothetical protein